MIAMYVYIPLKANVAIACERIQGVTAKLQSCHLEAFMVISQDPNHATLDGTLAAFHSVVD